MSSAVEISLRREQPQETGPTLALYACSPGPYESPSPIALALAPAHNLDPTVTPPEQGEPGPSPVKGPYISPTSPLHLPYISHIPPPHLPYVSHIPPLAGGWPQPSEGG